MQPVTHPDDLDHPRLREGVPAFLRVAVLCRTPEQGARWGSAAGDMLADSLADRILGDRVGECLTHFDYFPIDFTSPRAGDQIAAAFADVQASLAHGAAALVSDAGVAPAASPQQPFDAVVIAGGPDIDSDIGTIHRVLTPCMREASVPVLCALGADDAKTILGDTAWRVFADPLALLRFIAAAVRPAGPPADVICEQIRSLGNFLVTEHAIEARILRDAAIVPALQKHLDRHLHEFEASTRRAEGTVEQLHLRLLREAGRLEQTRAKIGVELARAQQRSKRRGAVSLGVLRLGVLVVFVCLMAVLWMFTSPASTVFFGGCALVLLSAAYVGIGNRIADRET